MIKRSATFAERRLGKTNFFFVLRNAEKLTENRLF